MSTHVGVGVDESIATVGSGGGDVLLVAAAERAHRRGRRRRRGARPDRRVRHVLAPAI